MSIVSHILYFLRQEKNARIAETEETQSKNQIKVKHFSTAGTSLESYIVRQDNFTMITQM